MVLSAEPQICDETGPVHAHGMGFVDDEEGVVLLAEGGELDQRRCVTEHGVDRFREDQGALTGVVPEITDEPGTTRTAKAAKADTAARASSSANWKGLVM